MLRNVLIILLLLKSQVWNAIVNDDINTILCLCFLIVFFFSFFLSFSLLYSACLVFVFPYRFVFRFLFFLIFLVCFHCFSLIMHSYTPFSSGVLQISQNSLWNKRKLITLNYNGVNSYISSPSLQPSFFFSSLLTFTLSVNFSLPFRSSLYRPSLLFFLAIFSLLSSLLLLLPLSLLLLSSLSFRLSLPPFLLSLLLFFSVTRAVTFGTSLSWNNCG